MKGHEVLEELKRALAELADEHGLELAIAFGSHARGCASPTSDVDVAVTLKGPPETKHARLLDLEKALASRLRVEQGQLDLVALDDEHISPAFRYAVLRKGRVLFAEDKTTLERLKADAEHEYLRHKPELLERLKRLASLLNLPGRPEDWEAPELDELAMACERALSYLDRLSGMGYGEFSASEENFHLACHFLRIALECVFDLGRRVLRLIGSSARSYGEVASALCNTGLLVPEMRPLLAELVEWRHRLTHVYFRTEPGEVYRFVRDHLADISRLIRELLVELRRLTSG